jgi:hypothetical protein
VTAAVLYPSAWSGFALLGAFVLLGNMLILPSLSSSSNGIIIIKTFCEARFAGLSPWSTPVRLRHRSIQFELVRHALCIIAPRSTLNEPLLTTVVQFSEERVVAWSLAQAAGERQNTVPHSLGSRTAFQQW